MAVLLLLCCCSVAVYTLKTAIQQQAGSNTTATNPLYKGESQSQKKTKVNFTEPLYAL
jgi:hypothetical protein